MKAYPGGKRTRIRAKRPDRLKRKYRRQTAGRAYTAAGNAVQESMARNTKSELESELDYLN